MAKNKLALTLDAPLLGIVKRTAYQQQPPFSCYSSINFWPVDARTGRAVSATRPPLQRVPTLNSSKCTMLGRVNGIAASKPIQGLVGAFGSDVHYWNGVNTWVAATGAKASSIPTNRAVYGCPFLQQFVIAGDTDKPYIFDYVAGTVETVVESAGTAPADVRIIVPWQGTVLVGGEATNPHILYMPRIGDFTDWDYGVAAADEAGAYFTGGENEGLITGPISAIMPQTEDTAIVSTLSGMLALRRHPRQGGEFVPISNHYVMGQGAWCKGPDDTLYMLTQLGMMTLSPQAGAVPAQVSRNRIPDELLGLLYDYDNPVISMAFDTRWNGVIIAVRDIQEQAWFYDIMLGGFHRMEFVGYPYVLCEYPPFIGETTSGVLFGGSPSNPLRRFDTFGDDEVVTARQIYGPVKISDNSTRKSMIQQLRVVFHRDSPTDDAGGRLKITAGTDGQDAINRLLTNDDDRSFECDLESLKRDNGTCYPKVAGHAAAIEIEQTTGSVAFEEACLLVSESGSEKGMRSIQLPVDGGPIVFDPPATDFDDTVWIGYSEATPDDPTETLTDMTLFIDLALLPQEWWDQVASLGQDIRATDVNNVPLPFDLIDFDYDAQTGFAAVKITQTIPARPVRLWVGNGLVGLPTADSEFGQYAAYDSSWRQFLPNGQTTDRTSFENHCTNTGLPTDPNDALVTGPMGNSGTNYRFSDTTNNYGVANASVQAAGYPVTLILASKNQGAVQAFEAYGIRKSDADTTLVALSPLKLISGTGSASTQITSQIPAGASTATATAIADNPPVWVHNAGVAASAASRTAYMNGVPGTTGTTSRDVLLLDQIVIGKPSRAGLSSTSPPADLSLAQYHTVARSTGWIAYQAAMMGQSAFWNGWGAFQEENDPPTPPAPDDVACPTGIVDVVETGTWTGYAEATPIVSFNPVEADWSHWIDLSLLPTGVGEWWDTVLTSGQDIRATDDQNQFLPLDLVNFSKSARTGFAVVRHTQTSTTVNPIRLWVGNAAAAAVSVCAAYGKYSAYDQYWGGFWPNGGGNDRTQFLNHLTMRPTVGVEGPAVTGDTLGTIGVSSTNYNGYDQYSIADTNALVDSPLTMCAVAKHPATNGVVDFDPDEAFAGPPALPRRTMILLSNSGLEWKPDNGRAATTRFAKSGGAFTEVVTPGSSVFHHYAGLLQTVKSRVTYYDGDDFEINVIGPDADQNYGADSVVVGSSLSRFPQTWEPTAGEPEADLQAFQPYYGDLCLVSMHSIFRGQDWVKYQHAMLDQATFYPTGWVWAVSSSDLPQGEA